MKICVIINLLQAKNAARNKIIEYAVETKERTMRALISVSDKTGVVEPVSYTHLVDLLSVY